MAKRFNISIQVVIALFAIVSAFEETIELDMGDGPVSMTWTGLKNSSDMDLQNLVLRYQDRPMCPANIIVPVDKAKNGESEVIEWDRTQLASFEVARCFYQGGGVNGPAMQKLRQIMQCAEIHLMNFNLSEKLSVVLGVWGCVKRTSVKGYVFDLPPSSQGPDPFGSVQEIPQGITVN
ncbi:hypothetical protein RF11_11399 [Thelohanellus kitauei]|uniref:Uncharacterized protein n=1 Tax=Thelohanellus kitauei TaxID=669202 RepID=A0A0C2N4Z9_THEKT|nr:hypothetical protein RF11_11399 [Thelohanellus kitauei]